MENKTLKLLILMLIVITSIQSITGFVTLYAGIYAKEFDKKKADEMLNMIKQTDKNYYDKIFDPEDKSYMIDFQKNYIKKGNKTAVATGMVLIIFSIIYAAILVLMIVEKKKEGESESDDLLEENISNKEKKEEETF